MSSCQPPTTWVVTNISKLGSSISTQSYGAHMKGIDLVLSMVYCLFFFPSFFFLYSPVAFASSSVESGYDLLL